MVRLVALATAAAGWVGALGVHPGTMPGAAASAANATALVQELHRAAVIVDTGAQTKSVCLRFQEDSISGAEALVRAGMGPVFRSFPGKGAAVCALCGTGCPGDESCLTCDPDGRFWAYSRAPAGTSVLRASPVGASSTEVRDGDVEGWRWARGGAPSFATAEEVCGESVPPATTTPSTAGPEPTAAPASPTSSPPGPAATSEPPTRPSSPGPASPAVTPAPTVSETTAVAPGVPPPGDGPTATTPAAGPPSTSVPEVVAAAPRAEGEEGAGNGWSSLAGFAALSGGLLAWAASARRRRSRP